MDLGLNNKNVLIVGASKGIGKSIALGFAKEKARITTIARNEILLKELKDEINSYFSSDHAYYSCDLMDIDINKISNKLLSERGVFDVVIHNVGGSLVSRNFLGNCDEWLQAWKFNVGIAIEMNSVFIKPMIKKGWGRIIHISSASAITLRGNPLYASSKAFLNAYVTTVGRSLAPSGVVLSAVMPGAVSFPGSYWDDFQKTNPERCKDFLRHHQGIGRFGTPQEVADVVLFMASEKASFMQTAIVPVDGAKM